MKGLIWIAVFAILVLLVAGGWYALTQRHAAHVTDVATGCLKTGDNPQAVLFMVDATDRLTSANADRVVQEIREQTEALPRYSRVVVVPFGDDTAAPLTPIFSKCLPGHGSEAGLDESSRYIEEAYKAFDASLASLKGTLESLPDSKSSPITDQIVRAASDPILHWKGTQRTLVLISDGLETSIYWSRNLKLKDPKPGLLDGVRVEYFELGNKKAGKLQSEQMRQQWKEWFERAGASVRMTAPGYTT